MNPRIKAESPKIILCKSCGIILDPKKALIHRKISIKDNMNRDEILTLWHFCNNSCQFFYIDNRGNIPQVILKPNNNKPMKKKRKRKKK